MAEVSVWERSYIFRASDDAILVFGTPRWVEEVQAEMAMEAFGCALPVSLDYFLNLKNDRFLLTATRGPQV